MTQFEGSVRFAPALALLLAELGSTGRLRVAAGAWSGDILFRDGQIVSASLGAERGRDALEGILVGLTDGEFAFIDEPVAAAGEPLLPRAKLAAHLQALVAERDRLAGLVPSLALVPRPIEAASSDAAEREVTISAAALGLLPALAFGRTLEQVAFRRGLARTVRELAMLVEGGLVTLEERAAREVHARPVAPATPAAAPPEPVQWALAAPTPAAPRPTRGARAERWRKRIIGFFVAEAPPTRPARGGPAWPASAPAADAAG
jgi:hypothetical protein